ncbi:Maf-like protein [Bacteroidia bacterium]|nr:Maf-like protein [Bacteroidia bacterium]
MKIILGSASPRRQQLLRDAGIPFELRLKDVHIPETYPPHLHCMKVPKYLAKLKAAALSKGLKADELLITADTAVILDNQVLGKPQGREDAIRMLELLSDRKHVVVTGVCLTTTEKRNCFVVKTDVYFSKLRYEDIVYYVDTFKPFDKAGAYGIQEWIGYVGIERIDGSFYNVMGLPIHVLLRKINIICEEGFMLNNDHYSSAKGDGY